MIVTVPIDWTRPVWEISTLVWRVKTIVSAEVRFATTISLIASGLVKLSKLQRATSLYRGIGKGRGLPHM